MKRLRCSLRVITLLLSTIMFLSIVDPIHAATHESLVNADTSGSIPGSINYADNIENVGVHTAEAQGYHFLLGASIVRFGDVWICAYGQGYRSENDSESRFVCKYSYDNCKTWGDEVVIAGPLGKYARSHGVLYDSGDNIWAFCPRAAFGSGSGYPGLIMEGYSLQPDMKWKYEGVVLDRGFWPLCEPVKLSDGSLLIAGLECESGSWQAAIALCSGGDLRKWRMIVIPNNDKIKLWGETTVIDYGEKLVAFIRTSSSGKAAVSESYDYGQSWSSLVLSDLDIAASKMFGGILSTGSRYLIFNAGSRKNLVIAIGNNDGSYEFTDMYMIKSGFDKESIYGFGQQWAYPYAVEDAGNLYVVYSENKEDCELSIIPLSSLKSGGSSADIIGYNEIFNSSSPALPDNETLCEIVNGDQLWWSGDGNSGNDNVSYTEIDGIPVVARLQSSKSKVSGNQVLRRNFTLDSGVDTGSMAFIITLWSSCDFSSKSDEVNRLFWGHSESKSGKNLYFSSDYSITSRVDLKADGQNLWCNIKKGWNTLFISFGELGYISDLSDINSFFIIFGDNPELSDGDIIFALSSVRVVQLQANTVTDAPGNDSSVNGDMLTVQYPVKPEDNSIRTISVPFIITMVLLSATVIFVCFIIFRKNK